MIREPDEYWIYFQIAMQTHRSADESGSGTFGPFPVIVGMFTEKEAP